MKKYIAILMGILVLAGCKKNNPEPKPASLDGDWELTAVSTKSVKIGSESVSVYISFSDGNFVLYQQLGNTRPRKYNGTYTLAGNVLEGKYSDGRSLGSKWEVSLENDSLKLVSETNEVDTYKKCTIPAEVKEKAY